MGGERAAIEVDKVRIWECGHGYGKYVRERRRWSSFQFHLLLGCRQKERSSVKIAYVDGTLLLSQDTDSTNEQGMIGIRMARPWFWPYPGSSSSRASVFGKAGR